MSTRSILAFTAVVGAVVGGVGVAEGRTIYVDFGTVPLETGDTGWNNMSMAGEYGSDSVADLVDSTGAATGISLATTDNFAYVNENGTTTPGGDAALFPGNAARDSWYINPSLEGFAMDPRGELTLSNVPQGVYNFGFFASRMSGSGANRETDYTINGTTVTLNAEDNISNMVWINNVSPDLNGDIVVEVTKNTSGGSFAYLGVMQVEAVPEPASLGLLGIGGLALLRRRRT